MSLAGVTSCTTVGHPGAARLGRGTGGISAGTVGPPENVSVGHSEGGGAEGHPKGSSLEAAPSPTTVVVPPHGSPLPQPLLHDCLPFLLFYLPPHLPFLFPFPVSLLAALFSWLCTGVAMVTATASLHPAGVVLHCPGHGEWQGTLLPLPGATCHLLPGMEFPGDIPVTHPGVWGEEGTAWGGPQQLRLGLGRRAGCMAQLYCCQKHSNKTFHKYFLMSKPYLRKTEELLQHRESPWVWRQSCWWPSGGDLQMTRSPCSVCQNRWAPFRR